MLPSIRIPNIDKLSVEELAAILGKLKPEERAYLDSMVPLTLRQFAEDVCGLNDLSPLMSSIFDASDGIPVTKISDAECTRFFGCQRRELPRKKSRTVAVRAGARAGKTSRLIACVALHAAWTVGAPLLSKGERAFVVLVAPTIKLARQALSFIQGFVSSSALLSGAMVSSDSDHVGIRRHDGSVARIEVMAAGRAGTQLRGKTLLGAFMEEAAFLLDEATGVINDSELYRAIAPRLVPGGQCWVVSTPWVAGVGLLEELIAKNWGCHDHALCVTAPTKALFPGFDPDGSITADLKANDPDNWQREIEAVPLASGSQAFFSRAAIDQAVDERRPLKLERSHGHSYFFGADFGFRRNSSALVVVCCHAGRYSVDDIVEIKPTSGLPLKPEGVVEAFAAVIKEYGGGLVTTDSHERDQVALEMAKYNISVANAPSPEEAFIPTRKLLHESKVSLPNHPRLTSQLKNVVAAPKPGGGLSIHQPRSSDGSHGDIVSAFTLAMFQASKPAMVHKVMSVGKTRTAGW